MRIPVACSRLKHSNLFNSIAPLSAGNRQLPLLFHERSSRQNFPAAFLFCCWCCLCPVTLTGYLPFTPPTLRHPPVNDARVCVCVCDCVSRSVWHFYFGHPLYSFLLSPAVRQTATTHPHCPLTLVKRTPQPLVDKIYCFRFFPQRFSWVFTSVMNRPGSHCCSRFRVRVRIRVRFLIFNNNFKFKIFYWKCKFFVKIENSSKSWKIN